MNADLRSLHKYSHLHVIVVLDGEDENEEDEDDFANEWAARQDKGKWAPYETKAVST